MQHIDDEGDYLKALYRDTHVKLLYPRMASGHLQGRMLKMFVRMIRPRQVLEIGTYSGYSALCIAEGLPEGGMLHTFEINDEQETSPVRGWRIPITADKIRFYIGDALELVPQLDLTFDLAFIDGDKRKYIDYYEMCSPAFRRWIYHCRQYLVGCHVLEEQPHRTDLQTISIKAFNDLVARDARVEKVILPLRDGIDELSVRSNCFFYLFLSSRLLRYLTGYHTDKKPTVMTVKNTRIISVACTLTG